MNLPRLREYFYIFALLSALISPIWSQPAYAGLESENTASLWPVSFPVLFATDRRQVESRPGQFKFKEQQIEDLDKVVYGVIHDKKEGDADKNLDFGEFSRLAKEYSKKSPKGVIVYLHGCCMNFQSSAQQAELTSKALQAPVIMYDWGSRAGSYAGSMQACERSQERFNRFMDKLTETIPAEQITIVGFSLGNQIIVDYCLQTQSNRQFKDIIMVRPDLDLVTFKSHVSRVSSRTQKIHLYTARNDIALACSKSLRCIATPATPIMRLGLGVAKDDISSVSNLTVLEVSQVDPILHLAPNPIMAELFKNDGVPPSNSADFEYQARRDGIVEVLRR